jgi:hypothetical protein
MWRSSFDERMRASCGVGRPMRGRKRETRDRTMCWFAGLDFGSARCGGQREKMKKKKNNSLEPHVSFPDDAAAAGRNGWIPLACHHHCPLRFLFPLATAPVALLTGRHHPARPRLLPAEVIWRPAIPSRADTTRFRFCPVVVSSFASHCRYVLWWTILLMYLDLLYL